MMQTPGVEAVYNGPEWLTTGEGLDRFKQRLGFQTEPVVFTIQLGPLVRRVLFNWGGRLGIDALGKWLSDREGYQHVQAVVDTAALSLEGCR